MNDSVLAKLIEENEWVDIPSKIITREGHIVDTSNNQWHLPYSMRAHSTLDFSNIINSSIRWITKRYIQEKIQTTSTHAGYSSFQDIKREFLRFQNDYGLIEHYLSSVELEDKLISIVEHRISQARSKHRLWALYRPIQWYIWCAENYPELGFCSAYAMELDSMILPGNPKGEAVRMEDPDSGPLHRSLELPLIIKALREDKSPALEHMPSAEISELVKKFAKRHNIISPLTGEILYLSTRRLRYTLATSLASERIDKYDNARLGIQLDDVIFAVAQVAEQCKSEVSNG